MEKFNWKWKYPHNEDNIEIIFDEKGINTSKRDENGKWYNMYDFMYDNFGIEFEKEYQRIKMLQREQKLKRILNGKIYS